MVLLRFFSVAVMACVCIPGFGSACLDSTVCNKGRILECLHLCMPVIQTKFPELGALALTVSDDEERLLSLILASLTSEDKRSDPDLKAHSDKLRSYSMEHFRWAKPSGKKPKKAKKKLEPQSIRRRSYSMEHFRWGKPTGQKTPPPKPEPQSNRRRSYSMEHFRWGKPTGRKRRPVKILASPLDGGGTIEGMFPLEARRQLNSKDDGSKGDLQEISYKSLAQLSPKERKDGTFVVGRYRRGNPSAPNSNGNFMKQLKETFQDHLAKLFRNNTIREEHRIGA